MKYGFTIRSVDRERAIKAVAKELETALGNANPQITNHARLAAMSMLNAMHSAADETTDMVVHMEGELEPGETGFVACSVLVKAVLVPSEAPTPEF